MIYYGTNTGYWDTYISIYQQEYGMDRTQAINHYVDLIKQTGFNQVRQAWVTNLTTDLVKAYSERAHQLGMTFGLQTWCRFWPPEFGHSSYPYGMDEQKVRAILNVDGEGDAWINDLVQGAVYYQADTIDIFNEPYPWDAWLVPYYNGGGMSWFGKYIGMSNDADYYNKYIAWCKKAVAALRAVKPDLLIIIDLLPFWDSRRIAADPIRGANIAYSLHLYYAFSGTYPSGEQWMMDYWNGNLNLAKSELYALLNTRYHGPLVSAGCVPYMEELGTAFTNPNWQQFMQDVMDYNKQWGFNVHEFIAYGTGTGQEPYGLLLSDWTGLNAGGLFVKNYLSGLQG